MLDEASFTQLMAAHKGMVFRLAYSYLRNRTDAEDVVQSVFVKLWRHAGAFASSDHVRNWLVRVTVNECTSLWRTLCRRPENVDDYLESLAAPEPSEHGIDVLRALMGLPARCRAPLYLYYYEGFSTHEVAEFLGISDATARTRLTRGRAKLRNVLEEGDAQ